MPDCQLPILGHAGSSASTQSHSGSSVANETLLPPLEGVYSDKSSDKGDLQVWASQTLGRQASSNWVILFDQLVRHLLSCCMRGSLAFGVCLWGNELDSISSFNLLPLTHFKGTPLRPAVLATCIIQTCMHTLYAHWTAIMTAVGCVSQDVLADQSDSTAVY